MTMDVLYCSCCGEQGFTDSIHTEDMEEDTRMIKMEDDERWICRICINDLWGRFQKISNKG